MRKIYLVLFIACVTWSFGTPAEAGWRTINRFFGEFWSDGYHSPGDSWSRNAKPAPASYYYPPQTPAHYPPIVEENLVPTPVAVPSAKPIRLPKVIEAAPIIEDLQPSK